MIHSTVSDTLTHGSRWSRGLEGEAVNRHCQVPGPKARILVKLSSLWYQKVDMPGLSIVFRADEGRIALPGLASLPWRRRCDGAKAEPPRPVWCHRQWVDQTLSAW